MEWDILIRAGDRARITCLIRRPSAHDVMMSCCTQTRELSCVNRAGHNFSFRISPLKLKDLTSSTWRFNPVVSSNAFGILNTYNKFLITLGILNTLTPKYL